jgi:hypothetical protein
MPCQAFPARKVNLKADSKAVGQQTQQLFPMDSGSICSFQNKIRRNCSAKHESAHGTRQPNPLCVGKGEKLQIKKETKTASPDPDWHNP